MLCRARPSPGAAAAGAQRRPRLRSSPRILEGANSWERSRGQETPVALPRLCHRKCDKGSPVPGRFASDGTERRGERYDGLQRPTGQVWRVAGGRYPQRVVRGSRTTGVLERNNVTAEGRNAQVRKCCCSHDLPCKLKKSSCSAGRPPRKVNMNSSQPGTNSGGNKGADESRRMTVLRLRRGHLFDPHFGCGRWASVSHTREEPLRCRVPLAPSKL
jgi:hypothetical protein